MRKDPKVINCRNTKTYTPDLFRKALSEASWDHILSLDDPHDMSEKWLNQFTEILDCPNQAKESQKHLCPIY